MKDHPAKITLSQWDDRYSAVRASRDWPPYVGPLGCHAQDGDFRLRRLLYDNSPAALRLWNFLLTEEDRLAAHRAAGGKIVGAMKDLGTVPVLAYSLPGVVAFYPDGAWWVPCIMELSSGDLEIADSLGIDESFCPVRAMLGAFLKQAHFPRPDLLVSSAGATCDDFSAIAQRLEGMGFPILWWEIPHRRQPAANEAAITLPGGFIAPASQVEIAHMELCRVRDAIQSLAAREFTDAMLADGIAQANRFRRLLDELRTLVYTAGRCPMPSLEMLIVEMLAIHFCSDRSQAIEVVEDLLAEVRSRVNSAAGVLDPSAVGVFWVNPVADLRAMNLLESCGGRLAGTDFMFPHALDEIPTDIEPMQALARMALADPMVGPTADRLDRICRDALRFGAQAVIVSRIPGASHCVVESELIAAGIRDRLHLPVTTIEVPPVLDSVEQSLRTRLGAVIEMAQANKRGLK